MARPILILSWATGLGLFTALALPASRGEVPGLDRAIFQWFQGLRTPVGDSLLRVYTFLGGGRALVPASIVIGIALARRDLRRGLSFWAFALGVVALEVGAKRVIGRPRPLIAPEDLHGFGDLGFPSGHAIATTALYGMLTLVLSRRVTSARGRVAILAGGACFALSVCLSRIYYAAHWPSDVLGGLVLGGTYLSIVWSTGAFDPNRAR